MFDIALDFFVEAVDKERMIKRMAQEK